MKTEVYSWRVSADLKTDLEREARRRNLSLAGVLDLAARDLLKNRGSANEDEEQRSLHQAAEECVGAFAGNDPRRSERARSALRARLRQKHAR